VAVGRWQGPIKLLRFCISLPSARGFQRPLSCYLSPIAYEKLRAVYNVGKYPAEAADCGV
jgi:hypothetical protein